MNLSHDSIKNLAKIWKIIWNLSQVIFSESFSFFNLSYYCACIQYEQSSSPERKAPFFSPLLWYTIVILSVVERKQQQMPHKGAINSFLIHCLWSALANGWNQKKKYSASHSLNFIYMMLWAMSKNYSTSLFWFGHCCWWLNFQHHLIVKF